MRTVLIFPALLLACAVHGAPAPADVRVGVALGSGSAHGYVHVGVIRELEARGLDVRVVSGTSVGALFGALWASGLDGAEIERIARTRDWDDVSRLAPSRDGFFSNDRLRAELAPVFAGRPIETWPRRFGAVATNIDNGHERVLMSGDGAAAVQASSAVPLMFRPVIIGNERLVDGALVEPVPVAAARAMGADVVIGVDVAYRPYEDRVNGVTGYGFQSMHILINTLAASELRGADVAIRLDVHDRLVHGGPDALIAAGREAVRNAWPEILMRVNGAAGARRTVNGNSLLQSESSKGGNSAGASP